MKFPRNARIFRGRLDAAPHVTVFFLLVLFVVLSSLVYTPGVRVPVQLPEADGLPGTDHPTVAVAVEAGGQYYFENQRISEDQFTNRLHQLARSAPQPLTLVVQADRNITYETVVHLRLLARDAGLQDMLLATQPRLFSPRAGDPPPRP